MQLGQSDFGQQFGLVVAALAQLAREQWHRNDNQLLSALSLSSLGSDRQDCRGQHWAKQLGNTPHTLILEQVNHLASFFPVDSVRNGALELRWTIAAVVAQQALVHELAGEAS